MGDPRDALDAIGQLPDVEIDLAGAALQFARIDAPAADWRAAAAHLSVLARDAVALSRELPSTSPAARAGALAALMGRHGYAGDTQTYEDLANANLMHVIERRRGLPVSLGILWLHCARAAGWGAHGVDFPGHFLLAMEGAPPGKPRPARPTAPHVILDVFAGGMTLEPRDMLALLRQSEGPDAELRPGVLQPMSARSVLLRLQRNIQARHERAGRLEDALSCTEDMLRVAPDVVLLWRNAAALNQALDRVAAALRCYGRVLDLVPAGEMAARTRAAMDDLRARLN